VVKILKGAVMTRRKLLKGPLAGGFWTTIKNLGFAAQPSSMEGHREFAEKPEVTLDAAQFYVLREEGTERPGSSPLR
jgi:hypothetical protein